MADELPRNVESSASCRATYNRLDARPDNLAEGAGFEPAEPCGSPVFKTGGLVRSPTPPNRNYTDTSLLHRPDPTNSISVPILALTCQYETIKPGIDAAVARLLASGRFILGPEVKKDVREGMSR